MDEDEHSHDTDVEVLTRMRAVVNQLAALGQRTGIGHYTVELLRCLRMLADTDTIDGYPTGWVRRLREECARVRPRLEGCTNSGPGTSPPSWLASYRSRLLGGLRLAGRAAIAAHFRAVCAQQRYDLYHETNFIPLPCDRPTLATIHDLSVILHPEWHPADRVRHFSRHFEKGLKRCQHFFAISEFSRKEISRELSIPLEKITRTYMGIRPGLSPLPREKTNQVLAHLGLPDSYLLHLGTLEPRKNVLFLMRAYCSLPGAVRKRWPLLLVGGWGWNARDIAEYLEREARHRGVIHLGYVAEEHLAAIYNGARALLCPTLYEGFGLPPIEMQACGGAVLASTAGALVETLGNHAPLINPHDMDAWRSALLRIVSDDEWWLLLRQSCSGVARNYTWDQCAKDTMRAYRKVLGLPDANDADVLLYPRPLPAAG